MNSNDGRKISVSGSGSYYGMAVGEKVIEKLNFWVKIKSKAIKKVIDNLHIQVVGSGSAELICPKENVEKFIDEMDRLHIRIKGITWWCYVTDGHEPCGMGGPKNRFGSGWYSEILMDLLRFDSNQQLRKYMLEIYPSSEEYKACYTPAFWL